MITVLIAHSEPLVCLGIRAALDDVEDCHAVHSVHAMADVPPTIERFQPTIVLLDVRFRQADANAFARLVLEHPVVRFVAVVEHSEEECLLRCGEDAGEWRLTPEALARSEECCLLALRAHARGCVPRSASPERVVQVIRSVASGEIAAGPWIITGLLDAVESPPTGPRPTRISGREMDVIGMVANGLSNKQIALRLGLREQTVKNHLARIMDKLGVANRVELAMEARQRRLA